MATPNRILKGGINYRANNKPNPIKPFGPLSKPSPVAGGKGSISRKGDKEPVAQATTAPGKTDKQPVAKATTAPGKTNKQAPKAKAAPAKNFQQNHTKKPIPATAHKPRDTAESLLARSRYNGTGGTKSDRRK